MSLTGPIKLDDDTTERAVRVVALGGLLAYPTDTVYALGCDPFNQSAVRRVIDVKRRAKDSLPVLVDSIETAGQLGNFNDRAVQLAQKFWPGPLTLVVPTRRMYPPGVTSGGKVGLRVPNRRDTRKLLEACGGALVGTSANLSGTPSAKTAKEVWSNLGESLDLILDGGSCEYGLESTVVEPFSKSCKIHREGALTREMLAQAWSTKWETVKQ